MINISHPQHCSMAACSDRRWPLSPAVRLLGCGGGGSVDRLSKVCMMLCVPPPSERFPQEFSQRIFLALETSDPGCVANWSSHSLLLLPHPRESAMAVRWDFWNSALPQGYGSWSRIRWVFLTPGSGMGKKSRSGPWMLDADSILDVSHLKNLKLKFFWNIISKFS